MRASLLFYSGPYSDGIIDIEVPARQPRNFSEIKRDHLHLLELETILFSDFYPSRFSSGQGKSPDGENKWSQPTGLPRPRIEIAKGYGNFVGIPSRLSTALFRIMTAFTKIPACGNTKLAQHWPPDKNSREKQVTRRRIAWGHLRRKNLRTLVFRC